jgi:hypothetical protein
LINPANYFNGTAHVKLGNINFTITMSESMDNSTSLTVKIINATNYTIPPYPNLTNGWLNSTTWVGNFTVTNSTGDGNYTIDISGGKDLAGNIMVENTSNWFIINTISPRVVSIIITPSVYNTYVSNGTKNFTIIFNEIMNTFVNPTVTFGRSPPYNTYNITPIGWLNNTTWVGSFDITNSTPADDAWYTISVSGAVDLSGNVMVTNTSKKFLVDRRPPRVWNIWVADPITTEENETVSVRVSDEKTIGQEASGVGGVILELNGSANFTMTLSYNYTYIGGAYFYYYATIPNSSYGPGLQTVKIYINDIAGNVDDTATASFFVSSPTQKINGTIAFLCREDVCNDNIEDELISWLSSQGWNVTGKKYSKWTSSELANYSLIMCSDEDYACNYGTRRGTIVYDMHTKQTKPFVEVGDNRFLRTAYNLGYASTAGGYTLSGVDRIFITVADAITTGHFDSTKIFTSSGTMTKIADNLVNGKDLADAGQESRGSTFFKSDQNGLRGRYVYVGWFGGGSFTSMNLVGNTTLARAVSWAQCGDAKGCG